MGYLTPDPRRNEEQPGGGHGLELDLDLKACPQCGRELLPWQATCPDDGAAAVPRRGLARQDLAPPPAHLLTEDEPPAGEDPDVDHVPGEDGTTQD